MIIQGFNGLPNPKMIIFYWESISSESNFSSFTAMQRTEDHITSNHDEDFKKTGSCKHKNGTRHRMAVSQNRLEYKIIRRREHTCFHLIVDEPAESRSLLALSALSK